MIIFFKKVFQQARATAHSNQRTGGGPFQSAQLRNFTNLTQETIREASPNQ